MKKTFKKLRIAANLLSALYLLFLSIVLLTPVPQSTDSTIIPTVISFLLDFDFYTHLLIFLIWVFSHPIGLTQPSNHLIAATLAALLELLQSTTSNRVCELSDLVKIFRTLTGFVSAIFLFLRSNPPAMDFLPAGDLST